MKTVVRACGLAAAAIALAATATFSAPSVAGEVNMASQGSTYLGHAVATVDGTTAEANDAAAPAVAENRTDMDGHSLAGIVSDMLSAAASMMPGTLSLDLLVDSYASTETGSEEQQCLAGAVYFEAQGEPLEGQLAVAEVVLNRASSGRYPTSICAVVTQKAQFSFIRNGRFPPISRDTAAWRKAVAISHIAQEKLVARVAPDVLWYHADYVAPVWRHNLTRVAKIGAHIFYS